jgi:hypothetical protein
VGDQSKLPNWEEIVIETASPMTNPPMTASPLIKKFFNFTSYVSIVNADGKF